MRVIILAGGKSKRLKPLTNLIPKTLLPLNERTILDYILDAVRKNGLTEIYLITGFGHEAVAEFAQKYMDVYPEMNINLVYHDSFETTGNLVGFQYGQHLFDKDTILINSDTIFHADILKKLLESIHPNAMVIDDYKKLGEEEMKVFVDKEGTITRIHKSLPPDTADGEYVGILKFSKEVQDQLFDGIEKMIQEDDTAYYEDGIQKMIDHHNIPVKKVSTDGLPVMEIDTHEDLAEAKQLIHKI